MVVVRDAISQSMRKLVHFCLQIIFDTILIYKLVIPGRHLNTFNSIKKGLKLAFNIIILNCMFILTNLPLLASIIYLNILNYKKSSISSNLIIANFVYYITAIFSSFTPATLFFVNLFVNKKFQRALTEMFFIKKQKYLIN